MQYAGWYEVSDHVGSGAVVAASVGDTQLVLWRDSRGVLGAHEAYCVHLGAHLGHGGEVTERGLRCPFHGWEYGTDGRCVATPYSDAIPDRSLRAFPVDEIVDAVFVHLGVCDAPQLRFAWFERHDAIATKPLDFGAVPATVIDVIENAADLAHFEPVHRSAARPVIDRADFDGPVARVHTRQRFSTPRGPTDGRLDIQLVAGGISYTEYEGLFRGGALATFTPVDDDHIEYRIRFRFAPETPEGLVEGFLEASREQVERDLEIWAHRRRDVEGDPIREDGPILQARRWAHRWSVPG